MALGVHHQSDQAGSAVTGVVLLGGTHGALSVARSFGRKNVPVVLLTDDHPLPKLSRYVGRSFDWPGALSPHVEQWLVDFAIRHGLRNWLLIPCADPEVKCVAQHLTALRAVFKIVSCDWSVLRQVCDKRLLATTAAAAGIDSPRSYPVGSVHDAATVEVQFPVVLKPAMRLRRNGFTSRKAYRANSRDELTRHYRHAAALVDHDEIVVQELIPGGGDQQFSYAALWIDHAPVVEMTARRTRQFPIEFGHTSTFVEVVDNDAVKLAGRRLLALIGFEGLVEIEFKRDARDGSYKVLDVNPRPWSWFALCEAAGLDLPNLMRNRLAGDAIPALRPRTGQVWLHLPKDVVVVALLMLQGRPDFLSTMKAIGRKASFAAFAWDDPLPALLELPLTAYRVVGRAIAALAAARYGQRRAAAGKIKAEQPVKAC